MSSGSTELYYPYNPTGNKIVGDLNAVRQRHALVTVSHPQWHLPTTPPPTIFAIGGENQTHGLTSVEEWEPGTQTWKMTNFALEEPRANFGALAVNREMICPPIST